MQSNQPPEPIPAVTVARLPLYLRALGEFERRGQAVASSRELALEAGVNPAQLRKDLSFLGSHGTRGVGYGVERLAVRISAALGLTQEWRIAMVGAGNLGRALAAYRGFATRGFRVAAIFDIAPELIGSTVAGLRVEPVERIGASVAELDIAIGVIATPAPAAQEIADTLVAAGIVSILNFAPCILEVPEGVAVRRVDLSTELQILAFHVQRHGLDAPAAAPSATADGPGLSS